MSMSGARSRQIADAEEDAPRSRQIPRKTRDRGKGRNRGRHGKSAPSRQSTAIDSRTLYIGTAVARNPRVRGAVYDIHGPQRSSAGVARRIFAALTRGRAVRRSRGTRSARPDAAKLARREERVTALRNAAVDHYAYAMKLFDAWKQQRAGSKRDVEVFLKDKPEAQQLEFLRKQIEMRVLGLGWDKYARELRVQG